MPNICGGGLGAACVPGRMSVAQTLEERIAHMEEKLTQLRSLYTLAVNLETGSPVETALNSLVWNQRGEGIGF